MYSNVNTSSLEQLDKLTSGPVSPAGVLRHDGSAHGTRGVSVKPRGHALLAEDVLAVQHRWFLGSTVGLLWLCMVTSFQKIVA